MTVYGGVGIFLAVNLIIYQLYTIARDHGVEKAMQALFIMNIYAATMVLATTTVKDFL